MFTKSKKLNNVCYDIRGPVMDEANRMARDGEKIIKLNIGNPAPFGFSAPDDIIGSLVYNIRQSEGYSDSKGILPAREAIKSYCDKKNIPNVSIDDIYTGNGVSELITLSMNALLDTGDEILVPSPDYPLWTASVTLSGGTAVHYNCREEDNWYPDTEDIKRKITPNTKGIVVINPNNPTGALYSDEILKEITEIARENDLIIFADEIYDRLVMDGKSHTAIASFAPDLLTVNFNGLSKSHLIAGYRCGWMVLGGDKSKASSYIEGINMLSSMRLCSNVPAQSLIKTALSNPDSSRGLLLDGGRVKEQRDYIYNALNSIPGVTATKPEAAFYIFPKLDTKRFNIKDDEQFALDLLKSKKLLITHGGGFHLSTPDHFRIVYLAEIETLKAACEGLESFLSTYKQC